MSLRLPLRPSAIASPLSSCRATAGRPSPSPAALAYLQQARTYAEKKPPQKKPPGTKKQRAAKNTYTCHDLKDADQFSLVEAIRYIRAFEVGQDPVKAKYELAIKLRTQKNGPTIKSRMALPKPVKTDMRICVIAEDEKQVEAAKRMGAVLVGKEDVFEKMRSGQLDFDKVICHTACFQALTKAKLGRILGPKGLMPSQRYGTVVENVAAAMKELVGKSDYRERAGVVRMAVGQLAFSDLELRKNIQAFMAAVKRDIGRLSMSTEKGVHEVVLSSTNSAGFSLTGEFQPVRQVAPGKEAPAPAPATPAAPKPSEPSANIDLSALSTDGAPQQLTV